MNKIVNYNGYLTLKNYSIKYNVNLRKIYRQINKKVLPHINIDGICFLKDVKYDVLFTDSREKNLLYNDKILTIVDKYLSIGDNYCDNETVNIDKILTIQKDDNDKILSIQNEEFDFSMDGIDFQDNNIDKILTIQEINSNIKSDCKLNRKSYLKFKKLDSGIKKIIQSNDMNLSDEQINLKYSVLKSIKS